MAKYELIEYDTWGNAEEGFEVNNMFRTGIIYEISDTESDAEIIHKLCHEEKEFPSGITPGMTMTSTWINPSAESEVCVANGFTDFIIEIETVSEEEPLGRLELVE